MGGGAMLPLFTSTNSNNSFTTPTLPTLRDSNFQSPPSLSSICEIPFGESWTKNRCIDYGSNSKILDIEPFDEKGTQGSPYYDSVFGSVPCSWEVEKAMSDLQSGYYAPKEEMNWVEPMLNPYQSTLVKSPGNERFYDALFMLQNEPSIQRLVCSIACDRAVWEAMMSNKAVQNLQGSVISAAKEEESQSSTGESDIGSLIVKWIMGITTSRIAELLQSFGSLLSEIIHDIFEPDSKEKPTSELSHLLEEKIRSSFLLSVILLLIVVVTRTQGT
ncbi:uncharacterized protein LOC125820915 isoform X2 [Solanum verrucosum]|uniref:uncharacterized protein LOC125820915 isoform X2 n=1 Tax=Solanum verrucosum TaxID=315347 RepID=UPI0020D14B0A|nr:uncharacterized protein LOC125820915 isoform X2 [Solanum verrucosum]